MDKQFNYLREIGKKYYEFANDDDKLLKALSELNEDTLREIIGKYTHEDRNFQPVNMLRAKSAMVLLERELSLDDVEEIKTKLREKDTEYFKEFPEDQLKGLNEYSFGSKRDVFANWEVLWRVFHVFFFRSTTKQTINQYLDQIAEKLLEDLELSDYQVHWVDFCGANNFGSDEAWIALYPEQKESHKEAYQFFIIFTNEVEAGLESGHAIKKPSPSKVQPVSNYDELIETLKNVKEDIIRLNRVSRNFFKFSPGAQAEYWEYFYNKQVIGIGYNGLELGDISSVNSQKELSLRAGLDENSRSNQIYNIWLFKSANKGDVVFANHGRDKVIGIGVIQGEYFYNEEHGHSHQRKVEWLTDKVYEYKTGSYQNYSNLFRPDTFSPTKISDFLLSEYVRLYPDLAAVFDKYKLEFEEVDPNTIEKIEEEFDDKASINNYWWLNANPKVWSISSQNEGDRQTYTSRNERGNKRRIYKYFETAEAGDLIIGYESSPVKQIRAIMRITKGLHHTEKEGEVIEFEVLEKLEVPVSWGELQSDAALKECEVFINNQGSLFRLTEDEFDIIRNTIDEKNIAQERELKKGELESYDYSSDPDDPFIPEDEFRKIHSILHRKKNIILQGPPGVGKTFIARKLAYHHMGKKNNAQIEMVQFHQSYSYEDFIQGLRLQKEGIEVSNGIFYNFCQKAHAHAGKPFFLIIDEINRGNLSKIFGELLMLIEGDKREEKYATKLTYADGEDDRFFVPDNVFLIGTMNTADRSLAIIDYALRRRFAFINLQPIYNDSFSEFLVKNGMSSSFASQISERVSSLNNEIEADPNLGSGFQIGHSYFCSYRENLDEQEWYEETLEFEIKPLLEEIWFDKLDKAGEMLDKLRG